jgi:hypothetical protein
MSDLQIATDIVVIVFIGIILLSVFAALIAALMLKRKVTKSKRELNRKIEAFRSTVSAVRRVFG